MCLNALAPTPGQRGGVRACGSVVPRACQAFAPAYCAPRAVLALEVGLISRVWVHVPSMRGLRGGRVYTGGMFLRLCAEHLC